MKRNHDQKVNFFSILLCLLVKDDMIPVYNVVQPDGRPCLPSADHPCAAKGKWFSSRCCEALPAARPARTDTPGDPAAERKRP